MQHDNCIAFIVTEIKTRSTRYAAFRLVRLAGQGERTYLTEETGDNMKVKLYFALILKEGDF
ncbi:MAG: hypothetical protein GY765_08325 [bacterium]|nr:hypothetical protein [bacterium]